MNQTQSPVVTVYQPLFALVKQIQWSWQDQFIFILGGLHIEMTILKMIGQILHRRTAAIEDSGVATLGTAEGLLQAKNVTKSRRALQIIACALFKLLKDLNELDILLQD